MLGGVHEAGTKRFGLKTGVCDPQLGQQSLSLALDTAVVRAEEARRLGRTSGRDIDEAEGLVRGGEVSEGLSCGQGVIFCNSNKVSSFLWRALSEGRSRQCSGKGTSDIGDALFRDLGLADTEGLDSAISPLKLAQHLRVIIGKVLVDNNVDPRVVSPFGHGDRPPTEDRDFGEVLHFEHGVEDAGADKAGGSSEDEMHDEGMCGEKSRVGLVLDDDPNDMNVLVRWMKELLWKRRRVRKRCRENATMVRLNRLLYKASSSTRFGCCDNSGDPSGCRR